MNPNEFEMLAKSLVVKIKLDTQSKIDAEDHMATCVLFSFFDLMLYAEKTKSNILNATGAKIMEFMLFFLF